MDKVPKKKIKQSKSVQGFTLVELLIATTLGTVVAVAAGELTLSSLRTGAGLENIQRLRTDWDRTSHFIESEVAMSERVVTDPSKLNLGLCDSNITDTEFAFGLEIKRSLPPAIYFVRNNVQSDNLKWAGDSSLWRCGPDFDANGEYNKQLIAQRLVDGLDNTCTLTVTPSTNGISKSLRYTLCMRGATSSAYAQSVNTYSRVSPVNSYPDANSLCSKQVLTIEGLASIDGMKTQTGGGDDELICGYGGGNTLDGSGGNDILEAGLSENGTGAELIGNTGNDRLVGGNGNDTLDGGDGDDVLIDGDGDDDLIGGTGDNQYRITAGTNSITGGSGLDVIYLDNNQVDVSGLDNCKRDICTLNYQFNGSSASVTATDADVIIFRDGRYDIIN
ncbi:prepilin-type N-terminal cleavage/methylation domain-containing protein [Synechococcus sp. AH-229-G18]|nr:prepilin-type N-terminal cleavage/methylation domain-containing protein [Synechococcus sp. AH-229-G18]